MGRKSIIKQMTKRHRKKKKVEKLTLIPSPSTLMNLACSDKSTGAFRLGRLVNIIGDSSSGKTIFCLSIGAEVCKIKEFDHYRIIYDDVENADEFNYKKLFGKKFAKRVEPPFVDEKGVGVPSNTIEDFHCNINDAIKEYRLEDRPFIYILDSFDALDSDQDIIKMEKMLKAHRENKKAAGTYAMSKPKKSSEILRNICGDLNQSESIVFIISQTRDNINPMSFEKKTRSGGRALKFYATHEIWLAMAGKIPSKDRIIGNKVKAKVSKNKLTGKAREVEFPVYYDYGVDDIRSCVDFLAKEKHWSKNKNTIIADDLNLKGSIAKIIQLIEKNNLEKKLKKIVGKVWNKIEESLKLNRKPRY